MLNLVGHIKPSVYSFRLLGEKEWSYVSDECKPITNRSLATSALLPTNKGHKAAKYLDLRRSHVTSRPLPNYIHDPPDHLTKADIDYLDMKDALSIPSASLRNELMRAYIQFVHPYLPILDLEQFLDTVFLSNGVSRVSLLLFQAVLAAGVAFVDTVHLRSAGYPSKKEARMAFFQRVRLLYDFDFEMDRVTLIQSLLLLTYWYPAPNDSKDAWHWVGVSLGLARTIGLHCHPNGSCLSSRQKRIRKRIWWSMYTRDRLIALGMRRPMHIRKDDSTVAPLIPEDFEQSPLSPEVAQLLKNVNILHNTTYQSQLALLFIEKVKLCLYIGDVLSGQYSIQSFDFGGTREGTMMLTPNSDTSNMQSCEGKLEDWLRSLPVSIQYYQSGSAVLPEAEKVLHLHRALLKMLFLTASIYLHRPRVTSCSDNSVDPNSLYISQGMMRSAATEIAYIARDLHALDLTWYCPVTSVTVFLSAMACHLQDMQCSDPAVRTDGYRHFHDCMNTLQCLRGVYVSADFAAIFLEMAIKRCKLETSSLRQEMTFALSAEPAGSFNTFVAPSNMNFVGTTLGWSNWVEMDGKSQTAENNNDFFDGCEAGTFYHPDTIPTPILAKGTLETSSVELMSFAT